MRTKKCRKWKDDFEWIPKAKCDIRNRHYHKKNWSRNIEKKNKEKYISWKIWQKMPFHWLCWWGGAKMRITLYSEQPEQNSPISFLIFLFYFGIRLMITNWNIYNTHKTKIVISFNYLFCFLFCFHPYGPTLRYRIFQFCIFCFSFLFFCFI